jgi:cytochrome b involved in lipid metabolism
MPRKIRMRALRSALFALISMVFLISFQSLAAEHPGEHPSVKPSAGEARKPLTKEEMSAAIQSYIEQEAKKNGGYYEIYDSLQNKNLFLKLKKIHDDRLSHIGNDVYFFCVDLVDKDGKVYDLDFFMKRGPGGDLNVTEVTIHKQEGKERYTWYEEKGIWKKRWLVQSPAQPAQEDKLPAGKPTIGDHPNPLPPR